MWNAFFTRTEFLIYIRHYRQIRKLLYNLEWVAYECNKIYVIHNLKCLTLTPQNDRKGIVNVNHTPIGTNSRRQSKKISPIYLMPSRQVGIGGWSCDVINHGCVGKFWIFLKMIFDKKKKKIWTREDKKLSFGAWKKREEVRKIIFRVIFVRYLRVYFTKFLCANRIYLYFIWIIRGVFFNFLKEFLMLQDIFFIF